MTEVCGWHFRLNYINHLQTRLHWHAFLMCWETYFEIFDFRLCILHSRETMVTCPVWGLGTASSVAEKANSRMTILSTLKTNAICPLSSSLILLLLWLPLCLSLLDKGLFKLGKAAEHSDVRVSHLLRSIPKMFRTDFERHICNTYSLPYLALDDLFFWYLSWCSFNCSTTDIICWRVWKVATESSILKLE